jgi:hypothetical protein
LQRIAIAFGCRRDTLNRTATSATAKKLKIMTKVIRAGTDEGGGCEQAHASMYGPPPFCKRKMRMTGKVCANVSGLCWSSDLLA